ncbi:Clr5 domain-containing protein [Fusarium sp. LHS14.1]|nr:Clr5 domain-containing protein [Fusarium sp. LHS14.1]
MRLMPRPLPSVCWPTPATKDRTFVLQSCACFLRRFAVYVHTKSSPSASLSLPSILSISSLAGPFAFSCWYLAGIAESRRDPDINMDLSTTTPAFFREPNPIEQQAYEPHGVHPALDGSASQWQAPYGQFMTDQNPILHPLNLPQGYLIHTPQNAGAFGDIGDTQTMPATPMGPPPKRRKKKAPTLRAEAWEPYKARILELHVTQKLSLGMVKKQIEEEFGFTAEIRQYRTRISQWGKDKNIKRVEMAAIVRKRQQRKLAESDKRELVFTVRDSTVEPHKIDRWMNSHKVPQDLLYAPSPAASTPSDVCCRTISERGSLAPSPAYSAQSPNFAPEGIMSISQSPAIPSPALSVLSIAQPQNGTFVGQSPAPIYRPLPSLLSGSPPTPWVFQDQLNTTSDSLQYRYKQTDEEHLREELFRAETVFGTSHSKTLDILFKLGIVLIEQGRYKSAEEMVRGLVEGRRSANGNNGIETLNALDLLGQVLCRQGFYAQAEKLHRRTFKSRKVMLGDEHPATLSSMNNLALIFGNQGRWKEAEELQVGVMEKRKRVLGEEHPDTLTSIDNLGSTFGNQGRWKEAEELQVGVIEVRKRVLGEEHPDTLLSMHNLAITWKGQGRWKEAEELQLGLVERRKKVLGGEHPNTLASMDDLASTFGDQGWRKEAGELQVGVMEVRKRVLGEEHPHTLLSMHNLAVTWEAQGRTRDALAMMRSCAVLRERVLGTDHPDTASSMIALAGWEMEI